MTVMPALRVVPPTTDIDLAAAERAAADLLHALGIETDTESLRGTPGRIARAYAELFSTKEFDLTTFPNDEGYDELVLARSIPLRAVCEHHLLPFIGVAHVGYLPGERILGLSKLARVVGHFCARPQVQERLTKQVAGWLDEQLEPRGVGVVIEAEHTCMTLRGVQARGATTVTSTLLGALREDPRSRQEFFALTGTETTAWLRRHGEAPERGHRRRRPGRRQGGRGAARAGLRRPDHAARRRGASCPTSGRRCPRATWPARTSSRRPSSTRWSGTPSTTSTCAAAPTVSRDRPGVPRGRAGRRHPAAVRRARAGHRLRAPDRWTCPAR